MVNLSQEIEFYVSQKFNHLGLNKKREIVRLLFEISKRENKPFDQILGAQGKTPEQFDTLKKYLINRRFPNTSQKYASSRYCLSEFDLDPVYEVKIKKQKIALKNVFIEKDVLETGFVSRLKNRYPKANFVPITLYKEASQDTRDSIIQYNRRMDSFYIVKENFDFFKRCACSTKSVYCGYHVINLGSGCAFECTYCYLQDYINSPGIVLPANIEDFFDAFRAYKQDIRLGSGEITDSLVFDHITEYSPQIVEFFKNYPKSTFEFKTKSNNVDLITSVRSGGNIVVAWSMNPQAIIETVEHMTASLDERLEAAKKCVEAGYKVAFHFDPIIHYAGWKEGYRELVNRIFTEIPAAKIAWMGIGTLRMTKRLKKVIENRFPANTILDEEFIVSYDGKLRYEDSVRAEIYQNMHHWIREHSKDVYAFLCMEEKAMCESAQIGPLKQYI